MDIRQVISKIDKGTTMVKEGGENLIASLFYGGLKELNEAKTMLEKVKVCPECKQTASITVCPYCHYRNIGDVS